MSFKVRFSDGPLDGVEFESPTEILELVLFCPRDRYVRYECDYQEDQDDQDDTTLNMVLGPMQG